MSQPDPTRADTLKAVIVRRQAIQALIEQEDDEAKVAKLCDAEDRVLLRLARRREPSDAAFFDKVSYLLAARSAEFGAPTVQDPFDVAAIAVQRQLEQRA